jgi:hypothetical protein
VIPGDIWPYFNGVKQCLPIPNCSKQNLTNLESLGIKNTSSIHNSVAMVLSRYDTDGLVSVWYCHGTDSGDFQKPSMLS